MRNSVREIMDQGAQEWEGEGECGGVLTAQPELEFETPARPGFAFGCASDCPLPGGLPQCRAVYRRDLAQAIRMALAAARLLETSAGTARVRNIYLRIFGHRPERPVPWAGGKSSAAITVRRLRLAARSLQRGFFRISCGPCTGHPTANAVTFFDRVRIELCPNYWRNARRTIRAGILIHETLHAYFNVIGDGGPTGRRRANAHCYEALVLLLHGVTPDPFDVTNCRDTPA